METPKDNPKGGALLTILLGIGILALPAFALLVRYVYIKSPLEPMDTMGKLTCAVLKTTRYVWFAKFMATFLLLAYTGTMIGLYFVHVNKQKNASTFATLHHPVLEFTHRILFGVNSSIIDTLTRLWIATAYLLMLSPILLVLTELFCNWSQRIKYI